MTILASLCYLVDGNQILMLHRNKRDGDYHKGKYNGLGGKFLPGESPEACAIREVFEESGLQLKELELRGILTFPLFDGISDWYCFVFRGIRWDGALTDCQEGTLEWVHQDQLFQLPLWPGDRHFLPYVFQEDSWFSGKFHYENGQLTDHTIEVYPQKSRE